MPSYTFLTVGWLKTQVIMRIVWTNMSSCEHSHLSFKCRRCTAWSWLSSVLNWTLSGMWKISLRLSTTCWENRNTWRFVTSLCLQSNCRSLLFCCHFDVFCLSSCHHWMKELSLNTIIDLYDAVKKFRDKKQWIHFVIKLYIYIFILVTCILYVYVHIVLCNWFIYEVM